MFVWTMVVACNYFDDEGNGGLRQHLGRKSPALPSFRSPCDILHDHLIGRCMHYVVVDSSVGLGSSKPTLSHLLKPPS